MKILEYCVNLLFYSFMCLDRFVTRIFNYCFDKTVGASFRKFVPRRYHIPGVKHPEIMQWDENSGNAFVSRWVEIFFAVHTLPIVFYLLYVIDKKIGVDNIDILFVLLFVIFLVPCFYLLYRFIDKNDRYKVYLREFEKKSVKWKRTCTIAGFLISLEMIFGPIIIVAWVFNW